MTDYPPAIQHRGPPSKVWPERNSQAGLIAHSMEGYLAAALAELNNETIPLSWHFSIGHDGTVYQHYDLEQSPWHAGSHAQNARLIGVEHEGIQGDGLTEAQFQASYALCVWIGQQSGWTPTRDPDKRTLWEHREIPGASTTCPNGRIPWYRYVPVPQEDYVDARPLTPDETLAVNELIYSEFTDIQIGQRGGGMYEVSGDLPVVNGQRIPVPAGGHMYLIAVPAPKAGGS